MLFNMLLLTSTTDASGLFTDSMLFMDNKFLQPVNNASFLFLKYTIASYYIRPEQKIDRSTRTFPKQPNTESMKGYQWLLTTNTITWQSPAVPCRPVITCPSLDTTDIPDENRSFSNNKIPYSTPTKQPTDK